MVSEMIWMAKLVMLASDSDSDSSSSSSNDECFRLGLWFL